MIPLICVSEVIGHFLSQVFDGLKTHHLLVRFKKLRQMGSWIHNLKPPTACNLESPWVHKITGWVDASMIGR